MSLTGSHTANGGLCSSFYTIIQTAHSGPAPAR